jgi:hypothetical protein
MTGRLSWLDWLDQGGLDPEVRRRAMARGWVRTSRETGTVGPRIPYPDAFEKVRRRVAEAQAELAAGRLWLWGREGRRTAPPDRIEAGAGEWQRLRFRWDDYVCWWAPLPGEQRVYFYDVQIGPPEAEAVAVVRPAAAEHPSVRGLRRDLFFAAWQRHDFPPGWTAPRCLEATQRICKEDPLHPHQALLDRTSDKSAQIAWAAARRVPRG